MDGTAADVDVVVVATVVVVVSSGSVVVVVSLGSASDVNSSHMVFPTKNPADWSITSISPGAWGVSHLAVSVNCPPDVNRTLKLSPGNIG